MYRKQFVHSNLQYISFVKIHFRPEFQLSTKGESIKERNKERRIQFFKQHNNLSVLVAKGENRAAAGVRRIQTYSIQSIPESAFSGIIEVGIGDVSSVARRLSFDSHNYGQSRNNETEHDDP